MKNLEKLFIVVFIIALGSTSFAQTFGAKAGLNLSDMLMKDDNMTYSDNFKMNPGFHVGATADFLFTDVFSLETGLIFSMKGYKEEFKEDFHLIGTIEYKDNVNLYYVDIPVRAKAAFDVGDVKVYGALGPYLGIGLYGKSKYEVTTQNGTEKTNEDLKWGSDAEDHFKRLDYGLTAGVGAEINSILIEVSYGFGLANIASTTDGGFKANNRILGISVGYNFGETKNGIVEEAIRNGCDKLEIMFFEIRHCA